MYYYEKDTLLYCLHRTCLPKVLIDLVLLYIQDFIKVDILKDKESQTTTLELNLDITQLSASRDYNVIVKLSSYGQDKYCATHYTCYQTMRGGAFHPYIRWGRPYLWEETLILRPPEGAQFMSREVELTFFLKYNGRKTINVKPTSSLFQVYLDIE